jgi:hypothetical protein
VRVDSKGKVRSATYSWTVDTTAPMDASVTGGSTTWTRGPVTIGASGSTDAGGGAVSYQHRQALDAGPWSAPANGAPATVAATGTTSVQFRAVDRAGNISAWVPAEGTADATTNVDGVAPTPPVVTGGAATWSAAASATLTPAGSTDSGGSGLGAYEVRTSSDLGATWSTPTPSASVQIAAEGETQVESEAPTQPETRRRGRHPPLCGSTVRRPS